MTIGLGPHLRMAALGVLKHWCCACDRPHVLRMGRHEGLDWDHNTDRPTFTGDIRHVSAGGVCHYFIREGRIEFLADSTHIMAGTVQALPCYPHTQP